MVQTASSRVCNVDLTQPSYSYCGESASFKVYRAERGPKNAVVIQANSVFELSSEVKGKVDCPIGRIDSSTGRTCNYIPDSPHLFLGKGWLDGATPTLGDSQQLSGGLYFTFDLSKPSKVTIQFQNDSQYNRTHKIGVLDAAFSLYGNRLPEGSTDDTRYDQLNPVNDCGLPKSSAPDQWVDHDPAVAEYQIASSPDCTVTKKPEWNTFREVYMSLKDEGGYASNGPYRDTLNFTNTGGLLENGKAAFPFLGQFNARGNWSIANDLAVPRDGDQRVVSLEDGTRYLASDTVHPNATKGPELLWAELRFIAAINKYSGREAGKAETYSGVLPAGHYTIAAGGARSGDLSIYGGKISLKID